MAPENKSKSLDKPMLSRNDELNIIDLLIIRKLNITKSCGITWGMQKAPNVSMPPYASMNGGHYGCHTATLRRVVVSGRLPSRNGQKWAKRVSRKETEEGKEGEGKDQWK